MQLVEWIQIEKFRSIENSGEVKLSDFTCISGRNNAGKSNIFRAINLFFTNQVEPNLNLDLSKDCKAKRGEKKKIIITVKFSIPQQVKFPKPLEQLSKDVGRTPRISKEYTIDPLSPSGFAITTKLDGKKTPEQTINQFLILFNFRYITSDRSPQKVLQDNLEELKAEIKYKLSKKREDERATGAAAAAQIKELSSGVFAPISSEMKLADAMIQDVRISTPEDVVDMLSLARYSIVYGGIDQLSERSQGHGIQNIMLFFLLYLVDRNYHRKFGWKIATIWLIEEPETFLHFELENQLARYLKGKTATASERMQILFTSHSAVFPQYSNGHLFARIETTESEFSTKITSFERHKYLKHLQNERVCSLPGLSTLYTDSRIIITEGDTDEILIRAYMNAKNILRHEVFSINRFRWQSRGGESKIASLIQEYIEDINMRPEKSGFIFLFDWDVEEAKITLAKKKLKGQNTVFKFQKSMGNPDLNDHWRGIERFLPSEFIVKHAPNELNDRRSANKGISFSQGSYEAIKGQLAQSIKDGKIPGFDYLEPAIQSIFELENTQLSLPLLGKK